MSCINWSEVDLTEGITTFSFCSALNELYFAVWVSPVVLSSSPVQWLYPHVHVDFMYLT